MEKKWYVVHVYSGYENKVKEILLGRIKANNKSEFFGEVLVPSENVVELIKGEMLHVLIARKKLVSPFTG